MSDSCKVGQILTDLSPTDRKVLKRWIADSTDTRGRRVSAAALAKGLTALGHPVGVTALKDHRGSRCCCYRTAG